MQANRVSHSLKNGKNAGCNTSANDPALRMLLHWHVNNSGRRRVDRYAIWEF